MLRPSFCTMTVLIGLVLASNSRCEESVIGSPVADFSLLSHRGRSWSLSDFAQSRLVVIAFLGTECPLAKLYGPRLNALHEEFQSRGVAFIGVDSNTQDSMTELTAYADRYGITFPLLKDPGNRVADSLNATRTPEVYLLDEERNVRYHGRVDDQYVVGAARDSYQRRDLAEAIEELLAKKPVTVANTDVIGCLIGRVKVSAPTGEITYAADIAEILNRRCVECHRAGELAPFPLTSYQDIIGWEDMIVEVIQEQRMPPWFANPEYGSFKNDARLTESEKDLIYQWVKNGMPEGDPADLPPAPTFAKGWRISKPDQVFYMRNAEFDIPAEGVVQYQHFLVDPGWTEDKYILSAEARPDNEQVVHHILVYIITPGQEDRPDLRRILVGYAPGGLPLQLEEGTAVHIPAGSKLLFQMHYTPNGYPQRDRSYAGVCFVDKDDVKRLARGRLAINTDFSIPPNDSHHVVTADFTFQRDEFLLAMTPHLHLRGKSFRYEAKYPDGREEVLLDVPHYDFNWQLKYTLAEPKLMPQGTRILCTAAYDNSIDNLVNPDPAQTIRWGDQSFDEMMIGFFDTIPIQHSVAARKVANAKFDPTGRWTWERKQGSKMINESLDLRLRDELLTGSLVSNGRTLDIENPYLDGDQLTFHVVVPELPGAKLIFEAQISDEQLRGEVTFSLESVGRAQKFPWNATRSTD